MGMMIQQYQMHCPSCQGSGEIINKDDLCKSCNGKKVVPDKKILQVPIDKGMKHGQKIVFQGEADQAVCYSLLYMY
jgi:DnaJ-class molecular chaperone